MLPSNQNEGLWQKFIRYFSHGPQFEFIADITKNTILFLVIYAVVVALNLAVHYLEEIVIDVFFIWGLMALEYFLFVCDLLWFFVLVSISTYTTIKAMIYEQRI